MNEALKNLLAKDRNALRVLHNSFYFDFCKEVFAYEISGRYTVNQVLKTLEANGYTPKNSEIVIISEAINSSLYKDLYTVSLNWGGTANTDNKIDSKINGNHVQTKLYHYWRKSDFESLRKDERGTHFVICQADENRTERKIREVNLSSRFKLDEVRTCLYTGFGKFIDRLELTRTDCNGAKFTFNNVPYKTCKEASEVIDKSGYLVIQKRKELKAKANELRANRKKDAYKQTDNTAELEALRVRIQNKKEALVYMLQDAKTAEEIKAVSDKLGHWHGLSEIIEDFENMKKKDAEKGFSSVETFKVEYTRIKEHLLAL